MRQCQRLPHRVVKRRRSTHKHTRLPKQKIPHPSVPHLLDLVILALSLPFAAPPGPYPLIQRQTDSVHLTDRPIKVGLEVSVRAQALPDVPDLPVLGGQLDGLEVRHVLRVEEHVPNGDGALVDLDWMTGQHDTLGDDARCRRRQERSRRHEDQCYNFVRLGVRSNYTGPKKAAEGDILTATVIRLL